LGKLGGNGRSSLAWDGRWKSFFERGILKHVVGGKNSLLGGEGGERPRRGGAKRRHIPRPKGGKKRRGNQALQGENEKVKRGGGSKKKRVQGTTKRGKKKSGKRVVSGEGIGAAAGLGGVDFYGSLRESWKVKGVSRKENASELFRRKQELFMHRGEKKRKAPVQSAGKRGQKPLKEGMRLPGVEEGGNRWSQEKRQVP